MVAAELGPDRHDLVVERAARVAAHGALRGVEGRRDHADEDAGARVRAARDHGEQHPAVGHRHADARAGRRRRAPPDERDDGQDASRSVDSGTGDDIAAACAFLCSDEAGYITGQVLGVNGGSVL